MTSNREKAAERTIYSGMCSDPDCMTSVAIWPHWERPTDLPEPEDWDGMGVFPSCPVCGETLDADFTDPMTPTIRTGYAPHQFEEAGIAATSDATLAAAAPEAVAEVVRLRKALDKLAHGAYVMASHYYYMGGKRYDDLGSTEQSYYEALTRILEGTNDD